MAAASIIARLLQAGTRQGQKAAAALLRMLKKSNPATLEKNVYKEYGNLGRKALSKDMLGPLSKFRAPSTGMPLTPKRMSDRNWLQNVEGRNLREIGMERRGHGFPKGVKITPGGMKTTKRGFGYTDVTPDYSKIGDITMRAVGAPPLQRQTLKEKNIIKQLRELSRRKS